MFSIGKDNFCYEYNENNVILFSKINFKTKKITQHTLLQYDNPYYTTIINLDHNPNRDYVIIEDYFGGNYYKFDGKVVCMQFSNVEIDISNFRYIPEKHYISMRAWSKIIIFNDVDTGIELLAKTVPNIVCKNYNSILDSIINFPNQSPDGLNILFYNRLKCGMYITMPMTILLRYLFDETLGQFLNSNQVTKYIANIDAINHWKWLTNDTIYSWRYQKDLKIYNIHNRRTIAVPCEINATQKPYFINGMFYVFLETRIFVADYDKIIEFPNLHKIKHYNKELNLYISTEYDIYIRLQVCHFIKFQFVGDFVRDRAIIPSNITIIVECLLHCEIICDVINEIYRQLLKIDPIIGFIY